MRCDVMGWGCVFWIYCFTYLGSHYECILLLVLCMNINDTVSMVLDEGEEEKETEGTDIVTGKDYTLFREGARLRTVYLWFGGF